MRGIHDDQVPSELDAESGLPIGPRLANPSSARPPERVELDGRYCRLEPIDPIKHCEELFAACDVADRAARFRYLPEAAPTTREDLDGWLVRAAVSADPLVFAVISKDTGRVEGRQSLMRIMPEHQSIEIGGVYWGPRLSRTPAATEASFLFAQHAFEQLGYRRFEWKCDALNAPSRKAALRFGFTYEGHFRRDRIIKGRTRDTVWFSIIDADWPTLKRAYVRWLDPTNFMADGQQKTRLSELTAAALRQTA